MLGLKKTLCNKYLTLDQGSSVVLTYIWVDGDVIRGKSRTFVGEPEDVSELPKWSFDGSATGQASSSDADMSIHPSAMFRDPFSGGKNKIVLCDVYNSDGNPTVEPIHSHQQRAMVKEFSMIDLEGNAVKTCISREISIGHYNACIYAGINIDEGTVGKSGSSHQQYLINPCEDVKMTDQVWVSRYLLNRIAEDYGVVISFASNPILNETNKHRDDKATKCKIPAITYRQVSWDGAKHDAVDCFWAQAGLSGLAEKKRHSFSHYEEVTERTERMNE